MSSILSFTKEQRASVARPTLLNISSEVVIPVPVFTGINSSGNPVQIYWIPPYQVRGRLVKPGMTTKLRDF